MSRAETKRNRILASVERSNAMPYDILLATENATHERENGEVHPIQLIRTCAIVSNRNQMAQNVANDFRTKSDSNGALKTPATNRQLHTYYLCIECCSHTQTVADV